jgi:hypothetical protein
MTTTFDPYGLKYGDWEDPYDHDYCTGCSMCVWWEGRLYEDIRAERLVYVQRKRIAEGDGLTPREAARQDNDYWNNQDPAPECST